MKAAYGVCLLCEKDLMVKCVSCDSRRPSNNYTEVEMKLSNDSRMKIAVCLECKDKIFKEDRKLIMDAIKAGWKAEQVRDGWSQDKKDAYQASFGDLEIVDG